MLFPISSGCAKVGHYFIVYVGKCHLLVFLLTFSLLKGDHLDSFSFVIYKDAEFESIPNSGLGLCFGQGLCVSVLCYNHCIIPKEFPAKRIWGRWAVVFQFAVETNNNHLHHILFSKRENNCQIFFSVGDFIFLYPQLVILLLSFILFFEEIRGYIPFQKVVLSWTLFRSKQMSCILCLP